VKLALIGTFYKRYDQSRACVERVLTSTRIPDEFWVMCETQEDADNLEMYFSPCMRVVVLPTPKTGNTYDVIPYSHKINYALDHTDADLIAYLDNGSMPHKEKYELMAEALEESDFGAVYCTQERTGFAPMISKADRVIADPFCVINYTQAMHRKTNVRWTLDMRNAVPDLADAIFWRDLKTPFYPVGDEILDTHHMESSSAQL